MFTDVMCRHSIWFPQTRATMNEKVIQEVVLYFRSLPLRIVPHRVCIEAVAVKPREKETCGLVDGTCTTQGTSAYGLRFVLRAVQATNTLLL